LLPFFESVFLESNYSLGFRVAYFLVFITVSILLLKSYVKKNKYIPLVLGELVWVLSGVFYISLVVI